MKNTFKKIIAVALASASLIVLSLNLASCNKEKSDYTVGVIQFGSHPSLDNCYQGVEEAIKASGYEGEIKIDLQNGNFDSPTCDTIAKNMVSKNYDCIVAIATPAAVSAYSAAFNTNIPTIFCAISDPVTAGIVESLEKPGDKCTGTSDVLDMDAQLTLIKDLIPDVKKVGVLYTTSEANSVSQLQVITEAAKAFDIEIVANGIQTAADIPQAAAALAAQVDCITNFTDNNVVNNLGVLLEKANEAGIPVFGSEIEQVKNGCIACVGLDYVALGRVTGNMALDVMCGGKSTNDIPVQKITEVSATVNPEIMEKFGIALPAGYENVEKVTTNS